MLKEDYFVTHWTKSVFEWLLFYYGLELDKVFIIESTASPLTLHLPKQVL